MTRASFSRGNDKADCAAAALESHVTLGLGIKNALVSKGVVQAPGSIRRLLDEGDPLHAGVVRGRQNLGHHVIVRVGIGCDAQRGQVPGVIVSHLLQS